MDLKHHFLPFWEFRCSPLLVYGTCHYRYSVACPVNWPLLAGTFFRRLHPLPEIRCYKSLWLWMRTQGFVKSCEIQGSHTLVNPGDIPLIGSRRPQLLTLPPFFNFEIIGLRNSFLLKTHSPRKQSILFGGGAFFSIVYFLMCWIKVQIWNSIAFFVRQHPAEAW